MVLKHEVNADHHWLAGLKIPLSGKACCVCGKGGLCIAEFLMVNGIPEAVCWSCCQWWSLIYQEARHSWLHFYTKAHV